MHIAVLGLGAVGSWLATHLSRSGHEVSAIARGETVDIARQRGVVINDEDPVQIPVYSSLAELGAVDVLVVCMKVTPETDIAQLLTGLDEGAVVATTQNSVEVAGLIADEIGEGRVWPGVVRAYLKHVGPAVVHLGTGPNNYTFGTYSGADDPRTDDFAAALRAGGIRCSYLPDVWPNLWEKIMFVATTGGLGALANRPLGYVREQLRGSLETMMREVYEVGMAAGIDLPSDAVTRQLAFADTLPAEATSSMQRDVIAGKASEVDAQLGAICRMGQKYECATPVHNLVTELLAVPTSEE